MTTLIERSKSNFEVKQFTFEEVQTGCLQRIADATEKMAQNYDSLIRDRDWYKKRFNELIEDNKRMAKRIAAYQGVIKRMKTTHK